MPSSFSEVFTKIWLKNQVSITSGRVTRSSIKPWMYSLFSIIFFFFFKALNYFLWMIFFMSLIQVEQALLKCCQEHRIVNITCQFPPMALPSNKWDVKIFICPTINIYRRVTFGTLVAAKPLWTSLPRSNGSTVWYLLSRYKLSEQNLYYYFHTSNTTFSKET